MKPVIGITCGMDYEKGRYFIGEHYVDAITAAGGVPFLLPPLVEGKNFTDFFTLLDALLLSGGVDVDPFYFHEEPLPDNGEISPERDFFELKITRLALDNELPVLAICRGIQVLNIAAGGNIYQDIYTQRKDVLKHNQEAPRWYPTHYIRIRPGSKLARVMELKEARVNSFHHQSVNRAAPGFMPVAWSRDGIIEAIENKTKRFVIGVQWHPELMWEKYPEQQKIFKGLIEAARESKKERNIKIKDPINNFMNGLYREKEGYTIMRRKNI